MVVNESCFFESVCVVVVKIPPKAWYERLSIDLLSVQIYADDIVFGATNKKLCENFAKEI